MLPRVLEWYAAVLGAIRTCSCTFERHRVTTFCAPTLYRMLVLGDLGAHDLSGLRPCVPPASR